MIACPQPDRHAAGTVGADAAAQRASDEEAPGAGDIDAVMAEITAFLEQLARPDA